MNHFYRTTILALQFSAFTIPALAKVVLPGCFTDNMVLQQKAQVNLWGKADAGKTVKITTSWNKKTYSTTAGADGSWKVKVATPQYGGPHNITFNDGEAITLENVLIGEVWICSGQSNMEMTPTGMYGDILNLREEVAAADYPQIRMLKVENTMSMQPLTELKTRGEWRVCSPETVSQFSAVAYFFARDLYKQYHIPIGLINTTWGGTVAEAWTSGQSLKKMPAFAPSVQAMEQGLTQEKLNEQYNKDLRSWINKLSGKDSLYTNGTLPWISTDFNDADWKTMALPGYWEAVKGLNTFDGVVAYRKKINIPAAWAGKDLVLNLGPVDDADVTWFNGTEVGHTELFLIKRSYTIPGKLVKAGENTIAIRVVDNGGFGGLGDGPLTIAPANENVEPISLKGGWSYRVINTLNQLPPMPYKPDGPNRPTLLYNAMVNPLINYTIKGAIWYQGESNADRAYQYRTLFPLLITDWREKWKQGNFPFYYVQLANFMPKDKQPAESTWAELREAQSKTLSLPNTGMAVTIDIGDGGNIHPANKQDVGHRLALIARAKTYDEKVEYSGPVYQSFKIKGNTVEIAFSNADGLNVKGGKLTGFTVADADKKFYWADAKIEGNKVIVSSNQVSQPVAVRYGWANNPDCNLYNEAALPASPFRTDDWQGVTFGKE
ncbi:9-O-acetylesterase [Mucilaginibacter limnophilus]|uniref:9-O-acetylesterase n=1 Tax=Mucilaginibacter limnophilus TaxID=1932778 RepID=A0A3S2V167_9SPHI|nr:sialate O-acetylesterase [Mucilaginibacter limnophilus]RVU00471.1 9-O-acetylesterase [Mucilaginibacter limnophilus]